MQMRNVYLQLVMKAPAAADRSKLAEKHNENQTKYVVRMLARSRDPPTI